MAVQDGTILAFGISSPTTTYGIVQNYSIEDKVDRARNIGPDGSILAIQDYGQHQVLTLTFVALSVQVDPPAIGTKFTFDGKSWSLMSVKEDASVDSFESYTITAEYYPQIGASS